MRHTAAPVTKLLGLGLLFVAATAVLVTGVLWAGRDAQADSPHAGLDFYMALDAIGPTPSPCTVSSCPYRTPYPKTTNACDTDPGSSTGATCIVPSGATLLLKIYLKDRGGMDYGGFDLFATYSGVTAVASSANSEAWPDCFFDASFFSTGSVRWGCSAGPSFPLSTYLGLISFVTFTCSASGSITLVHGPTDTALDAHAESGSEALTVNCSSPTSPPPTSPGPPTNTPTYTPTNTPCPDFDTDMICDSIDPDDDNDGCPDVDEQQMAVGSETSGGRRNYHNHWDYFNPTADGTNRIDDVTRIVDHYGHDDNGDPLYSTDYDRTELVGGYPWQFGPPDGTLRVPDILAAVRSYGHDCP